MGGARSCNSPSLPYLSLPSSNTCYDASPHSAIPLHPTPLPKACIHPPADPSPATHCLPKYDASLPSISISHHPQKVSIYHLFTYPNHQLLHLPASYSPFINSFVSSSSTINISLIPLRAPIKHHICIYFHFTLSYPGSAKFTTYSPSS